MLKVVFLVCENMLSTSVTLPLEQLRSAASLALATGPLRDRHTNKLESQLVSCDGNTVTCHSGLPLQANSKAADISEADIIYLPALWRNPLPILRNNSFIPEWLQAMHQKGTILAGVSTGCYFLAEAGLLDHKPGTTHWHYFDNFARRYPLVELKRDHFITKAGNIFCTGSVNSLADLTIHFIQRYFSNDIATHVERHFFHEIRKAYGGSRSFLEMESAHADEEIAQVQLWFQEHYHQNFSMTDVAQNFKLSPRHFNRRFKKATGKSPLEYLQDFRIETARDLLRTSNLSVNEIMLRIGYMDAAHFNALFKKAMGIAPRQYRTTVRAKLFSPL